MKTRNVVGLIVALLVMTAAQALAADKKPGEKEPADQALGKYWFPKKNGKFEVTKEKGIYSGRVIAYDYVPGELWPVKPKYATTREGLFTHNERVVIWIESPQVGRFAVVMVGATGVGNIRLAHAEDSVNWRHAGERRRIELDEPLARGDELGAFRLGSTVVLVFEPGAARLAGDVGTTVRFGEVLGEVA